MKKNNFEMSTVIADQLAEFHDIQKRNDFFVALGEKTVLLGEKDIDELNGKNKKEENDAGWRKFVPFVGKKKKEYY